MSRKSCTKNIPLLVFVLLCQLSNWRSDAFSTHRRSIAGRPTLRQDTACNVLAEPPKNSNAEKWQGQPRNKRRVLRTRGTNRHGNKKKEDVHASGRWARAVKVESRLRDALDALQESTKLLEGTDRIIESYPLPFPAIRDCNAALASFGDGGNLLRALRLYFRMRKAAALHRTYPARNWQPVPIPTLVTFSTLMSRAMYAGKPLVAIRLWNIMSRQPDFFSSQSSVPSSSRIVPDVKAANILMNAYAKLGDIEMAQDLFDQMLEGDGNDVPKMSPNIVTYNTLLDACHKSGELDIALRVKERLDCTDIRPDARTYTTLIATVARKGTAASGANDPTMAFAFLREMQSLNINPNGMTYSALIDVCGRCQRSDLALKGLRLMLDQKAKVQTRYKGKDQYTLSSEVGAWTAAIDACGKAGRLDSAVKLFYSMPNFGVYPNTITCGSLVDCLLRNGRTAESLDVLRYMKRNRIAPSEVMYTSLMTSASRLAEFENQCLGDENDGQGIDELLEDADATKAVEVYAELMASVSQAPKSLGRTQTKKADPNELFRVSLVFQEMKSAGVEPDLACYNALLKACAHCGDVDRAMEVLDQINASEDMDPNEQTWNSVIRAAGKAGRSDVALLAWQNAVEDSKHRSDGGRSSRYRNLSDRSLGALISALVQSAEDVNIDRHTEVRLYELVVKLWESIVSGSDFLGMNRVSRNTIVENNRIMGTFLHSVVSLENFVLIESDDMRIDRDRLRNLAVSIVEMGCFQGGLKSLRRNVAVATAYQTALDWKNVS